MWCAWCGNRVEAQFWPGPLAEIEVNDTLYICRICPTPGADTPPYKRGGLDRRRDRYLVRWPRA